MKLNRTGGLFLEINEFDSAFAYFRQAQALAERFDLADRRYASLSNLAITYDNRARSGDGSLEQALADIDSATACYSRLLEMVRATSRPQQEAHLLYNVAVFYDQSRADPTHSESLYSRSMALSEQVGDESNRARAVYGRACVRAEMLRLEDARRDFTDALEACRKHQDGWGPNRAWAEHYVEVLDTLIGWKSEMPAREWQQKLEKRRAWFRDVAREVKKLGVAEPSGFGREKEEK